MKLYRASFIVFEGNFDILLKLIYWLFCETNYQFWKIKTKYNTNLIVPICKNVTGNLYNQTSCIMTEQIPKQFRHLVK